IEVSNANSVILLVSMATNFVNYADVSADPAARVQQYFTKAEHYFKRGDYEQRKQAHSNFYKSYFSRVSLDLGDSDFLQEPTDKRIALFSSRHDPELASTYFQFGRYLLISSSQPGGQPANLQGLWNHRAQP